MPIFSEDSSNPLKYPIIFRTPLKNFSSAWIEHVPFVFYVMSVVKPSIFVELGTSRGDSYCAFCQAVTELNLSTRCFAVNTWAADSYSGSSDTDELNSLHHYHDSLYNHFSTLIQNTFDNAVEHFEDRTIDLMHVDSDHTYQNVKPNLEVWRRKLSRRAVIIFHNINQHTSDFGAWNLFEELKDKHPCFTFFHGSGLGVIAAGDEIPTELLPLFQLSEEEANVVRNFFQVLGQRLALNTAFAEEKQVEDDLRRDLQGKEEQLKVLENEIKSIRVSKEQLEKLLAELQQSFAFNLLARYRALLEKFLPQGSRQRRFYSYLLKKLHSFTKPNFSVIVFQTDNAGSRIVQESLIHAYKVLGQPVNVYQCSIFSDFDKAEEILHRQRLNSKQIREIINAGRQIRRMMDRSKDHTWKIINLVQDPVARNIATFFRILDEHIPDWRKRYTDGKLTIDEIQNVFLSVNSILAESDRWFDEQLLSVTGVDVFVETFPRDTGYKIYNQDSKSPVLILRLEDLERIGVLALQEFLRLDNIELINTQLDKKDEKKDADLRSLFQQNPLPSNYLQETYNTKYAKTFYTETEIARFLVKWQRNQKNENPKLASQQDPIIIYQMGKVGSKTIEQSLIHYYQSRDIKVDIYHTHFLNHLDKLEKDAIENGISSHGIQKIREAQDLMRRIQEDSLQPWRVISLVRDPVARNIASFFQSLSVNELVPDWKERYHHGQLDIQELQNIFLGLGDEYHQYPANWFDTQLKPVFDIDVFTDAFPYQTGYKIYESTGHIRLLVIRMENINDCVGQAMHEYLGLTAFKILNSNLGTEKDYADVYKKFKSLSIPAQYLEKVYNTKFARHFYSDKEINNLKAYWMAVTKDSSSAVFR